jgi:Holliday junction resolvase
MLERNLQRMIIDKVLRPAGYWYLNTSGKPRRGVPDLLICVRGRLVGMEVKRPGQQPTKLQEHELERIAQSGGVRCVVHSMEEAREAMEEIERGLRDMSPSR